MSASAPSAPKYRRILKGAGIVAVANVISTALGLILLLVLARNLSPSELAIVVGIIAIIDGGQMFLDASVNTGMVSLASKRGSPGKPNPAILRAGFWSKIVLGVGIALLIAALARPMSMALIDDHSIAPHIALAGLAALVAGMHNFVMAILQSHEAFLRIAIFSLFKNAFRMAVVLPWILTGNADPGSIALSICMVPVLVMIAAFGLVAWDFLRDDAPLRGGMLALLGINGWMALTSIAMFGGRLDVWLVGVLSTAGEAGRYAVAAQLCVGVGVLTQALVTAFLPAISRFKSGAEVRDFLRRWARILPLVVLLPLIAWPISSPVIVFVFGIGYEAAAPIFNLLFTASVMTLLGAPLMLILLSAGEAKILAGGTFLQLALRVGLALLVVPAFGGIGLGWADIASRIVAMALIGIFVLRAVRRSVSFSETQETNAAAAPGRSGKSL